MATRVAWEDRTAGETNWMWVEISAFSSNLAITQGVALMPGMLIVGIIGATYGTHLTAQREAWRPTDHWEWGRQASHPIPDFEDIDMNPLTEKFLPVIGGSARYDEN